jgi:CBS domain-containing protein
MPSQTKRQRLLARDVMSQPAMAIGPGTSLDQAVALMTRHKVSGLPVADDAGRVVGMLTEGDLMRRAETGTLGNKPGWLSGLFRPGALAADYVHTHGRRVEEIMTGEVISVEEDTPLTQVVAMMLRHRVKRLPVLRGDRLVGIVSRADIVARLGEVLAAAPVSMEDGAIRRTILAAMEREPWSPGPLADVSVKDGVVQLSGCLFDVRARDALQVLAENTPGVTRVENNLVCIEPQSGMLTFDPAWRPASAVPASPPV